MPTLVLRDATSDQTWTLTEGRLIVARRNALRYLKLEPDDATLALDDDYVSREHAVIRAENGQFLITDTRSTDGTYVNDRRIRETISIGDGDRLRFGDSILVGTIMGVASKQPDVEPSSEAMDDDRTVDQPLSSTERVPERFSPVPITAPPPEPDPVELRLSQPAPQAPPLTSQRLGLLDISAAMRQCDQELASAMETFERAGGRPALLTIIAQAHRVEANPSGAEDLQALLTSLPTLCSMLELERRLIDLF